MKNTNVWNSKYFYGNKISDYGLKNGYVDYRTLANSFNHVLNNDIVRLFTDYYFELVNGCDYDDETGDTTEVFQFYIISENGYKILEELTDEIVYYNSDLDMYIWGITHFGTSWDYVLTDIPVELED